MYRSCRAGRNAWRQLVSGACHPQRRAATTSTSTSSSTSALKNGNATTTTTTTTTTITTVTTETRPSAPGTHSDETRSTAVGSVGAATKAQEQDGIPQVIFSGIQPTGIPHLGNYLGALREWKRLQDKSHPNTKLLFCIADLHAITVPRPPGELYEHRMNMMAILRAMGLDENRSTIFFQSAVPYHTDLQWILSCTASMGYLSRMTQWKSKMQLGDNASMDDPAVKKSLKHGLFSYPILQAADILIHRATHVPVGEDQRQHLEFSRECVTNFNNTYKTDCLIAPRTLLSPSRRIMSLTKPQQKMSKSDPSPKSRILITDSHEEIQRKIRGATTDSIEGVTYDPENRPGVANLIEILSGFDPKKRSVVQLGKEMQGYKIADLKQVVAQVVCDELAEVRDRYQLYLSQKDQLQAFAAVGNYKAQISAKSTMDMVNDAVGLGPLL